MPLKRAALLVGFRVLLLMRRDLLLGRFKLLNQFADVRLRPFDALLKIIALLAKLGHLLIELSASGFQCLTIRLDTGAGRFNLLLALLERRPLVGDGLLALPKLGLALLDGLFPLFLFGFDLLAMLVKLLFALFELGGVVVNRLPRLVEPGLLGLPLLLQLLPRRFKLRLARFKRLLLLRKTGELLAQLGLRAAEGLGTLRKTRQLMFLMLLNAAHLLEMTLHIGDDVHDIFTNSALDVRRRTVLRCRLTGFVCVGGPLLRLAVRFGRADVVVMVVHSIPFSRRVAQTGRASAFPAC